MSCKECEISDYCSNVNVEMTCEEVKRRYESDKAKTVCNNETDS